MTHTVYRTCTLCEAMCGLSLDVEGDKIVDVRPDEDDVFSHGYICPKGAAIAAIHNDPDRLRTPMRRMPSGEFQPISWDEAFALVGEKLNAIRAQHGADAIALYMGNPIGHNHAVLALRNGLFRAWARATAPARVRRTPAPDLQPRTTCTARRYRYPCPTLNARTTFFAWVRTRASRTAAF